MKIDTSPTPTVLGQCVLKPFRGDCGERHVEVELNGKGLLDSEYPSHDALAAVAGLVNACCQLVYDFDKEVALFKGRYPAQLSDSIAADIDFLIRTALNKLTQGA